MAFIAMPSEVGLASICDVAVGVEGALIGLMETKLGLILATTSLCVIMRMGEALARQVSMSSRMFTAVEAERFGLLAYVVPEEQLSTTVAAEVDPDLSCASGAVGAAKALTCALGPKIDTKVIEMTISALILQWESFEAT